jgi:hypothetical protein
MKLRKRSYSSAFKTNLNVDQFLGRFVRVEINNYAISGLVCCLIKEPRESCGRHSVTKSILVRLYHKDFGFLESTADINVEDIKNIKINQCMEDNFKHF